MASGGKRPGAGRKKGYSAKSAEEARRVFAELVSKEVVSIAKKLINQAKMGDIRAVKELLDRAYGRPLQPIDQNVKISPFDFIRKQVSEDREKYR